MPPEITLQEVHTAVGELRHDLEQKSVDHDKVVRIGTFLDTYEEKVNQPLAQAVAEQKKFESNLTELKAEYAEKLEAIGVTGAEQKARIDALELEVARASAPVTESHREKPEYKAFNVWCQKGDFGINVEEKQLLRTDSDTAGGFLVTTEMDTQITKKITEIDPIRGISRVRTTSSKTLVLPIRNTIPVATYEGEQETGTDSVSSYQGETVTPFRQTFTAPITMDMLMDASFDMEGEIAGDAAEAFAFGEGSGFVSGTGFKQPAGFASNANLQAASRPSAAAGVLDPEALILLTGDLKVGYDPVYVLNRRTLALIRTFRADAVSAADSAGGFLWMPGFQDGSAAGPVGATLNGFPYVLANSMQDVGSDTYPVAFGDFRRGYTIIDRTGMSVIRDEVTQKRKAIVEFTMNRWNTGRVVLEEPIRLLHTT